MYQVVMGVGPDDERIADKVGAVADLPDAPSAVRVTVVHATDEASVDVTEVDSVAAALARLREAGITATAMGVAAGPTEAVLSVAEDEDADCICVAGRRRSPAGKLQLKTGAQQVILRADCPVLVAGQVD